MNRSLVALAALTLAAPTFAGETYVVDKNHSEVTFQVRHFVTKVRGRFTDFQGTIVTDQAKPESSSVEFAIKTASIDTDVEKRDNHLRSGDFFDAERFPEISFKSSKILSKGKNSYDVAGTLTMHGVSKEIRLPVSYLGAVKMKDPQGNEREKAGFETALTLNRKDFGILWNQAMDAGGFVLGDEVFVTINIEANKQPPKQTSN